MNYQEIFDTVVTKLLAQNCKAMEMSKNYRGEVVPTCVYSNEKGERCAVGHLIPDGHAALSAKCDASELMRHYPDLVELFDIDDSDPDTPDIEFLMDIQTAHDSIGDHGFEFDFKCNMSEVATAWNLNAKVLNG